MYDEHKGEADFYLIYTKEAHAVDSRRPSKKVEIMNHKTIDDREAAANKCLSDLSLSIPTLVDDMKDSVATAYSSHPDRLFIIDDKGKIAYRGDRGPRGFDIEEMKLRLLEILK